MQRLVEQPTDDGDLFHGGVPLGRVHYHLSVYQHFSEAGEPVPPNLEVEGRIVPVAAVDLIDLHRRGSELTLRLADGRTLECAITNEQGHILSTGRGLQRA